MPDSQYGSWCAKTESIRQRCFLCHSGLLWNPPSGPNRWKSQTAKNDDMSLILKYCIAEEPMASSALLLTRTVLFPGRQTTSISNLGKAAASNISSTTPEVGVSSWREFHQSKLLSEEKRNLCLRRTNLTFSSCCCLLSGSLAQELRDPQCQSKKVEVEDWT